MLGDAEGEDEVAPLLLAGMTLRRHGHLVAFLGLRVLVLHQDAAGDAFVVELAGTDLAALLVLENADIRLLREDGERLVVVAGREQRLDEELVQALGQGHVDDAIDGDHGAEGAHGIAFVGLVVGGRQVLRQGTAAGVVVFDDDHARQRELVADVARRIEVVQVVEAELLAVQLLDL